MTKFVERNEMLRNGMRVLASLVAIASLGSTLTSCLWSSNNAFPIFATEGRGGLEFVWCGPEIGPYRYISVHHRSSLSEDGEDEIVSAYGSFSLHNREAFSLRTGPSGLDFQGKEFEIGDGSLIFIYFGDSASELTGPNPQFTVSSKAQISNGNWLSPTGVVTQAPCS